ncbi:hypothetical protein ACQ4PT_016228 [Festuca glaucescens]
MDFNPFLREGSPSETSSSLTSEAECDETSFEDQLGTEVYLRHNPDNENTGDCALLQKEVAAKGFCEEGVPEDTSTQLYCENGEGRVNRLVKEPVQTEAPLPPSAQNSHPLSPEASEEDAICRRTRARYSLANYALDELETFLQESDHDGDLQNVDEEEEYRKFLAAVLSGGGDDTQVCQGDETQDEDENDADFELEIEEALESDGDDNVENYQSINGRNNKDDNRPQTRKNRPELSRAFKESTKSNLRPILPNVSPALLAPLNPSGWRYPSQNINVPSSSSSSLTGAAVVNGFTVEQLGQLHMLIYEHVQLMIQTFSLCVLDPSKQRVAADVKKMIVELVGCHDQALARRAANGFPIHQRFYFERQHLQSALSHASSESSQCQWIPSIKNPILSILDVSPLHSAPSYLSDVAAAVVKYRRSHVDGTADKTSSRKEPLFPSPVLGTGNDANNVSQDGSNNVSTASPASPGQLQPKKSLAATLVGSTKKDSVALVPSDIARLTQRFYAFFNFSLFPHKPPPVGRVNQVLFTDAEDGLLALGLLEYNNDWGAIQRRFLPCKSTHQIFVRQKNRSSSKAPDNPIKDVRRMKTSPLSTEEIHRIEEGIKIFRNDWTSICKFLLPYRDPTLLQRQWRVATGVQRSYTKSDAVKERRRLSEAKRRKLRASVPDSQVREQEADDDASEGVENDDDSYVNEAFLADTENRSINMIQMGTSADEECGAGHGCFEQHNRNRMKHGVSSSYTPISSYISLGPSTKRGFGGILGKEKGSHVVKLAPDLPAINLPPSVRVISQMEFHQNAAHLIGTSDNAAKDVYTQLNLFPDHSASDRLQQRGIINGSAIEDGAEQDFPMHPLLFQHPREVHSSYSHPVENLNQQTTDGMAGAPVNANTIDFHPLLQRTEGEMHGEASTSRCERENIIDLQASTSACERESNIDLDIHLCSSMDFRNAEDIRSTITKFSIQPEGSIIASISNLEPVNAFHHNVKEPSEGAMQGIVMEQEELTDSEEDIQHVEFECEEMDDSEEEQVQDAEPCSTENKGTSTSFVCSEFQESNDQCQIEQGLEQVVEQAASPTYKSHELGRGKLKPHRARHTGSRTTSQRLPTPRTSEPSRTKTKSRRASGRGRCKAIDSRSKKSPAPS